MATLLTIFKILQNPIPQYVLGSLPAILTIGTTPHETLLAKFLWFVRCLGCPFAGLFYFCSIESNSIEMSAYWLESKNFIRKNNKIKNEDDENDDKDDNKDDDKDDDDNDDDEDEDDDEDDDDDEKDNSNKFIEESSKNTTNKETRIVIDKDEINIKTKDKIEKYYPRPFGHHSMKIKPNKFQKRILKDWIAEASLLDRLLLGVSAYYILVGIVAGISKAAGPCTDDKSLQDWPYIPMLFIWTLPVIYVRIRKGKVVSKVLPKRLKNEIIVVKYNTAQIAKTKRNWVFVIFCVSLFLPWLSVIIAYWTPPVGFFCRSKFLMLICLIWSFSSIAAYASHIKGEKDVYGPISIMFSFFGVVVGLGLIFLSILANFNSLWVTLFGPSCYVPLSC